jgi:cellulase (glycosyl hydrolase family 5)
MGKIVPMRNQAIVCIVGLSIFFTVVDAAPPGVAIHYSPAADKIYLGSPGIAKLPNGTYLAKCDEFGPGSVEHKKAVTLVFRSADQGKSWQKLARIDGLFWASIFVHKNNVYLFGTDKHHGNTVILRSTDNGKTWTTPKDKTAGLLLGDGKYHTAPVPVVIHNSRIWRAMEDAMGPGGWGSRYRAFMMSAPVDADLLQADSWTCSNRLGRNSKWLNGKFGGWLEGNAIVTPDGQIVNILRADYRPAGGKAAVIQISPDGKKAAFESETGFIDFPGGCKKFTIRYDKTSQKYWTLSNAVLPHHVGSNPERTRNAVALMSSPDLKTWAIRCVLIYNPDTKKHGYQYPDWLFEGEDIIAAIRTAHDDDHGGAHNQHDANFLTFHRIKNFRQLKLTDSAPGALLEEKTGNSIPRTEPKTMNLLAHSTDASSAMSIIELSDNHRFFIRSKDKSRFTPWGFNYDHDADGILLEDYWEKHWPKVEADFQEMKELGANVVRIHLQVSKFMLAPGKPNPTALGKLEDLITVAEHTGLYLDITGLGCYHKKDVPLWYDKLSEKDRWEVQARFWEAIAKTCAPSSAIFCYDLMNEPVLPGADRKETEWLLGEFGGKYFVQRISLDLAGRSRQQVAKEWVDHLAAAIRKHDRRHLITVGVIPWVFVFPKAKPLFYSREVAENLDFVSVHFYPKTGESDKALTALKAYDMGKPIVIEEMFPLKCNSRELRKFILASRKTANGWISFYWGKKIDHYTNDDGIAGAITKEWLTVFKEMSSEILK